MKKDENTVYRAQFYPQIFGELFLSKKVLKNTKKS